MNPPLLSLRVKGHRSEKQQQQQVYIRNLRKIILTNTKDINYIYRY